MRADCKNLQRSQILVSLSQMDAIEIRFIRPRVQFGVWFQKYELVKNFFYRRGGKEVVIGEMQLSREFHSVRGMDIFIIPSLILSQLELSMKELPKSTPSILMKNGDHAICSG